MFVTEEELKSSPEPQFVELVSYGRSISIAKGKLHRPSSTVASAL